MGASQGALVVKNPSANAGDIRDMGLIPGLGRPLGGGYGNPLQYSCLENPMDRGAWRAIAHRVIISLICGIRKPKQINSIKITREKQSYRYKKQM